MLSLSGAHHARQGWKGLSPMVALQGSLGHKGQGLSPSSMERDSKVGLFPACSDQQGMRPTVSTVTVLSLACNWVLVAGSCEWLLCSHCSSVAGPASWLLTSWVHSFLALSLPAHPVLPVNVWSSSLVVASAYIVGSLTEARVVLSFSLASSNRQQIFSSSSYVTVDNSPSGLRVPKLASSVVLSVSSLLLPKQ